MKPVLHTVSYAGVWRGQQRLTLEETLQKAADLGYGGVEIVGKRPHASLLDCGPAERERLRAQLERLHLDCACIAGYTNFTADAEHPDIPNREIQILYVTELARLASDLDGRIVRVFTGYERADVPRATQWDWCVSALRECADRARPYGVTIAIQNHHDLAVTAADLADMIAEIDRPNCGAAYDAWAPTRPSRTTCFAPASPTNRAWYTMSAFPTGPWPCAWAKASLIIPPSSPSSSSAATTAMWPTRCVRSLRAAVHRRIWTPTRATS